MPEEEKNLFVRSTFLATVAQFLKRCTGTKMSFTGRKAADPETVLNCSYYAKSRRKKSQSHQNKFFFKSR